MNPKKKTVQLQQLTKNIEEMRGSFIAEDSLEGCRKRVLQFEKEMSEDLKDLVVLEAQIGELGRLRRT